MELWAIAREFGLPLAFLAFALFSGRAGVWVWGRELTEANRRTAECEERWKARHEAAVADWRERLRQTAEDYEVRIAKIEAAEAGWESLALSAHGIARTAAAALDKAVK